MRAETPHPGCSSIIRQEDDRERTQQVWCHLHAPVGELLRVQAPVQPVSGVPEDDISVWAGEAGSHSLVL
jgi:hypothetical protein